MKISEIVKNLDPLIKGIDPFTGELLPKDSIFSNDKIRASLEEALRIIKGDYPKEDFKIKNSGTPWSAAEELFLIERYKSGLSIREIAKLHSRSIGSIRSRLGKNGYLDISI